MKINIFLILLLSVMIISCNTRNNQHINELKIDRDIINIPENIFDAEIDLDELINEIDFIPLETTDECLIGHIDKILSIPGYYFIQDRINKTLFKFSQDGKFITKIGSLGQGPKEYLSVWDIILDKKNKFINVLDLEGYKIIKYTYDGDFIGKTNLKLPCLQFEYKDNFIVAAGKNYGENAFDLIISDLKQKTIEKAFPVNPSNKSTFTSPYPLRKFSNDIYYSKPFSNSFWIIKPNEKLLAKIITLDFGDRGWSQQEIDNALDTQEIQRLLNKYEHFGGQYVFSSTHRFFEIYGKDNKFSKLFQDIKSKNIIYGKSIISSKILNNYLFETPKWLRDDDRFITIMGAFNLCNYKNDIYKYSNNTLSEKQKEKIESVKQEDNPIIITYTLKHF